MNNENDYKPPTNAIVTDEGLLDRGLPKWPTNDLQRLLLHDLLTDHEEL